MILYIMVQQVIGLMSFKVVAIAFLEISVTKAQLKGAWSLLH